MQQSFITCAFLSSIDKKDVELDVSQVIFGGSYAIDDCLGVIASELYGFMSNFIHPRYNVDSILKLLVNDGKYKLLTYCSSIPGAVESVMLTVDNEHEIYTCDLRGSFISRKVYTVSHIEESLIAYVVSEHIIGPYDECDLIERCYVPYFSDLSAAKQYCNMCMSDYSTSRGSKNSGYRISVVDSSVIVTSDWYNLNLEAARLISEYELNQDDYRYIDDISSVIAQIHYDAYDKLNDKDRFNVNVDMYKAICNFLPEDNKTYIDSEVEECIDYGDISALESLVDNAIAIAVISTKDEESFNNVISALGNNCYRLSMLTDDIYVENPDVGGILIDKGGNIKWYKEYEFMDSWPGNKGNPWYGKFQPNEPNLLLCFREFHPELVVDCFPFVDDIARLKQKYDASMVNERKESLDYVVRKNRDGDDVVVGNWYYNGLESSDHEIAKFFRSYGSHVFTDEECKELLSGKEISIEHFITKSGIEITARGKLQRTTDMFDTPAILFCRTDIDMDRRAKINAEHGIS